MAGGHAARVEVAAQQILAVLVRFLLIKGVGHAAHFHEHRLLLGRSHSIFVESEDFCCRYREGEASLLLPMPGGQVTPRVLMLHQIGQPPCFKPSPGIAVCKVVDSSLTH